MALMLLWVLLVLWLVRVVELRVGANVCHEHLVFQHLGEDRVLVDLSLSG